MSHIATLISNPAKPAVTDAAIAAARAALPAAGKPIWLAPGIAVDVPFSFAKADLKPLADALREKLAPAQIDVVLQPAEGRRKRLYLTDMDSTVDRPSASPRIRERTSAGTGGIWENP